MFGSLIQALNLDSTFFVQFLIFLLLYPLLSQLLIKPFYNLYKDREDQTRHKVKSAEDLKRQVQLLQASYDEKAKKMYNEFNQLYEEQSYQLKRKFAENREIARQEMERKHAEDLSDLKRDIQNTQQDMELRSGELVKAAFDKLSS